MKTILALFVFLGSAIAFAGDTAEVVPLGFSKDGSSYAFANVGTLDGYGAAYAEVSVINVAKNTLAYRSRYVAPETLSAADFSDQNLALKTMLGLNSTKTALKKAAITAYQNLGKDVLIRLPTDLGATGPATFSIYDYGYKPYTVNVSETVLKEKQACIGYKSALLTVTLTSPADPDIADDKEVNLVMQKDTKLPSSRNCASNYKVARVTVYKTNGDLSPDNTYSVVSIISYQTTGFEGPDVRHIGVTAVVDLAI